MDGARFDTLSRSLSTARSRRRALTALIGGTLGLFALGNETTAKKKSGKGKGGKGKKKKPACPGKVICNGACLPQGSCCNDFGCPLDQKCINQVTCEGCAAGFTQCGPPAETGHPQFLDCIETQHNPQHCGGCNIACGENMYCLGGRCICDGPICQVPGGSLRCCPAPGGTCCLDTGHCCPPGGACAPNFQCLFPT
jgi:hypothetical protein